MKQALHILVKDIRYLWIETLLTLLLTIAFVAAALIHTKNNLFAPSLLPLSCWMAARLIYSEPLTGDRQFWVTRPYAWTSLLGSKLLFLFLFVIVPSTIVRLTIVVQAGFPLAPNLAALVWSEFLMWAAILPFAALAAVLPAITPLILTVLLVMIGMYLPAWVLPGGATGTVLGSLDWVRDSFAVLAAFAIGAVILYVQYRRRATVFSRTALIAGAAIACATYFFFPWNAAFAIQKAVAPGGYGNLPLHFELAGTTGRHENRNGGEITGTVGIAVKDIPSSMRAQIDSLRLDLVWPDGRSFRTRPRDLVALESRIDNNSLFQGNFQIGGSILTPRRPVKRYYGFAIDELEVHGAVYLTLLGNPRTRTVPLRTRPAIVANDLECMRVSLPASEVVCRSPFRWPGLITASFGGSDVRPVGHLLSWSPFPAGLELDPNPIQTRSIYGSAPEGSFEMSVTVYEPVAHLKREFTWKHVEMPNGALIPSRLPDVIRMREQHRFGSGSN